MFGLWCSFLIIVIFIFVLLLSEVVGTGRLRLPFGIMFPESIHLFHYTNMEGAQSIARDQKIKGSTDKTPEKHRRYGKGVYFTSMPPSSDPNSILSNNYDDRGHVMKAKIEWVVEVIIPNDNVKKVVDDKRPNCDVYLYPNDDVDLRLYPSRIYPNPMTSSKKLPSPDFMSPVVPWFLQKNYHCTWSYLTSL